MSRPPAKSNPPGVSITSGRAVLTIPKVANPVKWIRLREICKKKIALLRLYALATAPASRL